MSLNNAKKFSKTYKTIKNRQKIINFYYFLHFFDRFKKIL